MNIERQLRDIETEVMLARKNRVKLTWHPFEIAIDLLVVSKQFSVDLEKYLNIGTKASGKRVRATSKILETLGKSFRVQSAIAITNRK